MLPRSKAKLDGVDHALEVGRQRVEVVEQCCVYTLLQCAEGVVNTMAQPRVGSRGVPPPGDGVELVLERMEGSSGPVAGLGRRRTTIQ